MNNKPGTFGAQQYAPSRMAGAFRMNGTPSCH